MSTVNVKQQVRLLVEGLPENCTWDDVMYQIYVALAVEAGLADSRADRVQSVEAVRSQFAVRRAQSQFGLH
ncbi:MAG: hypothetical protein AAGG51_20865 [Cyanobacteria bacterium P01_G01_bin.54]